MSKELLLGAMIGLASGSLILIGAYELRDWMRSRREKRLRNPLEDDLYPYYPTPRPPKKEKNDEKFSDI